MDTQITHIIFDADDTLVDYEQDASRAFLAALSAVGKAEPPYLEACSSFDHRNWEEVGLSAVHLPRTQSRFHELYREHVHGIFVHALGEGDAAHAEEIFLREFFRPGTPVEGARETVSALRQRGYSVYAATNGLSGQRERLSGFALDGVFISEELRAIKPSPAFFEGMLKALGVRAEECLMVGDSLSSDIAGAAAVRMPCLYFNRHGGPSHDGVRQIRSLTELPGLLR